MRERKKRKRLTNRQTDTDSDRERGGEEIEQLNGLVGRESWDRGWEGGGDGGMAKRRKQNEWGWGHREADMEALVGTLNPVNHKGLNQGQTQSSFYLQVISQALNTGTCIQQSDLLYYHLGKLQ